MNAILVDVEEIGVTLVVPTYTYPPVRSDPEIVIVSPLLKVVVNSNVTLFVMLPSNVKPQVPSQTLYSTARPVTTTSTGVPIT